MVKKHLTELKFNQFKLEGKLLQAVSEIGWSHCTPIQSEVLPLLLRGENVACQAQTGTGKTAAYLLAIFNLLLTTKSSGKIALGCPAAVIIAPTRELAIQIHKDALQLSKHTSLKMALVYGGISCEKQIGALNKPIDLLIGTPGRMIDFYKQKLCKFNRTKAVILDEADRMFDLGFIKDIRYLLRRMSKPEHRLNMLCSATLSYRVMELAYDHMDDPLLIRVSPEHITADNVKQSLYHVSSDEKIFIATGVIEVYVAQKEHDFCQYKKSYGKNLGIFGR